MRADMERDAGENPNQLRSEFYYDPAEYHCADPDCESPNDCGKAHAYGPYEGGALVCRICGSTHHTEDNCDLGPVPRP